MELYSLGGLGEGVHIRACVGSYSNSNSENGTKERLLAGLCWNGSPHPIFNTLRS